MGGLEVLLQKASQHDAETTIMERNVTPLEPTALEDDSIGISQTNI